MGAARKEKDVLGRLKSFGLSAPWQVALLLPHRWDDFRTVHTNFAALPVGERILIEAHLPTAPTFGGRGVPKLSGRLVDRFGNAIGMSVFGDTRELQDRLKPGGPYLLHGIVKEFNGRLFFNDVAIMEPHWAGRLRPVYPGKTRVITPDTVRDRVIDLLGEAIPVAAKWLTGELRELGDEGALCDMAGCPGWTVEDILWTAHLPMSPEEGAQGQRALEFFAAIAAVRGAWSNKAAVGRTRVLRVSRHTVAPRAKALGFALTDEQRRAIAEICDDLGSATPMRRLLSGDVGTGKTAVYACGAAAVADAGGRVAILAPNMPLAEQVANEIKGWWPDLRVQLVTAEEGNNVDLAKIPILVGTTALLHKRLPHFDLVIVDEQQKFSREQRERLLGPDGHLLEATATCIPRSAALARYGVLKVSQLTKCFVEKNIITTIWDRDTRAQLFREIETTIAAGAQALIVYPLREGDPESESLRRSAAGAVTMWENKFPGRVRLLHGEMDDEEKARVLADMKAERASVLIATTVVEVGITIPNLRRAVVIQCDRFGLVTLHQIRGRVARHGGTGYFDLFLPRDVKPETRKRMEVLTETNNGFEVAERDLLLRGAGNLRSDSDRQSGADESFLFGRPISIEMLDAVAERLRVSA